MSTPFEFMTSAKYKFLKPNGMAEIALYDGQELPVILSHAPVRDDLGMIDVDNVRFTCRALKSDIDRVGVTARTVITVGEMDYKITKLPMADMMGEVIMFVQEVV